MHSSEHLAVGTKRKRKMGDEHGNGSPVDGPSAVNPALDALATATSATCVDGALADNCKRSLDDLFAACKDSEAKCAEVLSDERIKPLLRWLDMGAWHHEVKLGVRDEFMAYVCSILGHIAMVSETHSVMRSKSGVFADIVRKLLGLLQATQLACPRESWVPVVRQACDAITHLSRDNKDAKRVIFGLHGIPSLVRLLDSVDCKVQRAAASVLRTLAFKEEEIKMAIVNGGALQPLIKMLRSEDHQTHYEAVGALGNLVHSSTDIKKLVLAEGVLQPVINLLHCTCRDSLREAALLVGQFAQCDSRGNNRRSNREQAEDFRVKIVQRGAVPPLIRMLKTNDRALREMAAFALGRLAQNTDNQAGIFAMGVLPPLLDLLASKVKNLEHNAAFTLYGLADNPDNIPDIIKCGGYERLQNTEFADDQPTKDCVTKTLKRIAEKVQRTDFVKDHLMRLLQSKQAAMKTRMAVCLAHLLLPEDISLAYTAYGGAGVLLDVVVASTLATRQPQEWLAALSSLKLVVACAQERERAQSTAYVPAPPEKKLYIGKAYVNNPRVHDVVFLVEDQPFYAHKLALAASSEAFAAMFESGCLEGKGGIPTISIPNIHHDVFAAMMTFIYTGETGPSTDMAQLSSLLKAADQYLLEELKANCAEVITRQLTPANVMDQYQLALDCNCTELANTTVAFMVMHHEEVVPQVGGPVAYAKVMRQVRQTLEGYLACYLQITDASTFSESARSAEMGEAKDGSGAASPVA